MTTNRRLDLVVGASLGVVALAAVTAFAVLLPDLTDSDELALPDSLPGGWVAADIAVADDEGAGTDVRRATDYVREVYAGVYDDPVAFRAYTDDDLSTFVVVTVFTSGGGAFGPPNGVADPEALELEHATTELVRLDDVVCVVNYEPVPAGQEGDDESVTPLGVSCQLPTEGHTIQLATNGLGLDDTVQLVHAVEDAL